MESQEDVLPYTEVVGINFLVSDTLLGWQIQIITFLSGFQNL